MTTISDLLLVGPTEVTDLSNDLATYGMMLFAPMIIISAVYEQLTTLNYDGLVKRVIFCFFVAIYGVQLFEQSVQFSFSLSDELISKYIPNSVILKVLDKETPPKENKLSDEDFDRLVNKKTGANSENNSTMTWDKLVGAAGYSLNSFVPEILFVFGYVVLWLIGHLYTLVFKLLIALIPFIASISLFPALRVAMNGLISSAMWCILCPIVSTIVLCILEGNSEIAYQDGTPFLTTLNSVINYVGYSVLTLLIPAITSAIISGKGPSTVGDTLGGMAASSALSAGQSYMMLKATNSVALAGSLAKKGFSGLSALSSLLPANKNLQKEKSVARMLGGNLQKPKGTPVQISRGSEGYINRHTPAAQMGIKGTVAAFNSGTVSHNQGVPGKPILSGFSPSGASYKESIDRQQTQFRAVKEAGLHNPVQFHPKKAVNFPPKRFNNSATARRGLPRSEFKDFKTAASEMKIKANSQYTHWGTEKYKNDFKRGARV